MKPLGFKRTKSIGAGHQHCGICHPRIKNGKALEKRQVRAELEKAKGESMSIIKKPMLADHMDPAIPLVFPLMGTPKIDGIRCLRRDGRTVSRTFLDIPNRHIQKVMAVLPDNGPDGELVLPGKSFNETQSAVMSEDGEPDFNYCVFDYVTTSLKEEYYKRMEKLKALALPDFCVKLLPVTLNNTTELEEYEAKCLLEGHEGIMIRKPNGPYKCGRSTALQQFLLKVKRFRDSEAVIIGFEELMSNQNEATVDELGHTKRSKCQEGLVPAGTLGKFRVREIGNTPWKGKEFEIGTGEGLTAALRQQIWDHQGCYLGAIVNYRYQPHGVKDLPRIPIWWGFRSKIDL